MAGAPGEWGRALLFTISPGAPFALTTGGAILVALGIRLTLDRSRPGRRWLRLLATTEHVCLTLLLVAMVALSLTQIVLRNAFDTGFAWVDPLLRHAVLWIGFMGAALATAHDRHISIDALSRLVHGIPARAIHAVLRLGAAGVVIALANAAYVLVRDEFEFESVAFLGIPTWVLMTVMPIALTVMAYRFVHSACCGPRAAEIGSDVPDPRTDPGLRARPPRGGAPRSRGEVPS